MLRGRTADGELIGLETIEGYNLQIVQLEWLGQAMTRSDGPFCSYSHSHRSTSTYKQ